MHVDWKDLKKRLDAEANKMLTEEPVEVKRLLGGIFPYPVGVGDQYFTTLTAAYGQLLGLGEMFVPPAMISALKDPDFTVEHCKKIFGYMHTTNNLSGFFGLEMLYNFTNELFIAFDSIGTKEELTDLMISYIKYTTKLFMWFNAMYPWGLGSGYRRRSPEEIKEMVKDLIDIEKLHS